MNRKIKAAALASVLVITPVAAAQAKNTNPVGIDVVSAQCNAFTFIPTVGSDEYENATWEIEALYVDTEDQDVYKRSQVFSGTVKFGDAVGPITIDSADQYLLWSYDIRTNGEGKSYVLYGELPLNCVPQDNEGEGSGEDGGDNGETEQPDETEDPGDDETPETETPEDSGTDESSSSPENGDTDKEETPENDEAKAPADNSGSNANTEKDASGTEEPAPVVVVQPRTAG